MGTGQNVPLLHNGDDQPTGILSRSLAILELLAGEGDMAMQDIADRLHIPRSATHRLLSELVDHNYVQQDRDRGHYSLTMKLVTLAFSSLAASRIVDTALPILERLADHTGELVRLAVVDGPKLTWILKAQGAREGLVYDPDSGRDVQLSCSATGWAWLSTLPDETALALVNAQGLGDVDNFGPDAPRTTAGVLAHLEATRGRGYSLAMKTYAPWMAGMAAPVRRSSGEEARGVVSIAGPTIRLSEERLHAFRDPLLEASAELATLAFGSSTLMRARLGRR